MIDRRFALVLGGVCIGGCLSALGVLFALDYLVKRSVRL